MFGRERRRYERHNRFHPDRRPCKLPAVLDMGQQIRSDSRGNRVEWGDIRIQTVAYMECRMKKDPQSCNSGGPKRNSLSPLL